MTAKRNRTGEMPFLDHLEELRWRILWSLLALVVGTLIGLWVVQHFDVLTLLKAPIAPLLPDGKLHVLHPADAFLITLKLAVVVGLVLATPVIAAQVWAFVAPALYEHERKYIIPALFSALLLFIVGSVLGYLFVLPTVLRILTSFQHEALEFMITANAYFGFAAQLLLAFGLLFELPLVMVILSALGLVEPETFARQRPLALIIGAVVAALLTPPDALSMTLMLGPIVLLYEIGLLLSRVARRRQKPKTIGTAALLLVLAAWPDGAEAQRPDRPPPDTATATDTLGQAVDTATARTLGLPTQPTRSFPQADSIMRALLAREGFTVLRYAGDTITLFGRTKEIVLDGSALVEQQGTILQADSVSFLESACSLDAAGEPVLFDKGTVLAGEGMHYDTCERRGTVARALTSFDQSGVTWYLRGGLGIDSASVRIYGKSTDISSCDLPEPHYHFAANRVKWVSNTIMVARPATLYVRDVPVLWMPFIFQDMRQGRRTGILIPRFGFSDLIRPNDGYRRHVSNIGFYAALNDYTDVQASLDWFSGNYLAVNGQFRYRWLDRFVSGGLSVSRIFEEGTDSLPGAKSLRLQWRHQQQFDLRTRLSANVDYATSARVVRRNTVDPFVQTATLGSQLNFSKQLDWGTLSMGGSRTQDLSNGTVTQTLPTVNLSPAPIDLMRDVTWSPGFSLTNSQTLNQSPGIPIAAPPRGGLPATDTLRPDQRTTTLSVRTPLRIGSWNWPNDFSMVHFVTDRPRTIVLPDPESPTDSVTRFYGEDFRTQVDWNTAVSLPVASGGRWNLQPSVGIRNSTSGPFLLRNAFTGGQFVSQGKRLSFGASLSPTLFGFFPGVGPVSRIRHSLSPRVSWSYAPSATVPEAYARALNPGSGLDLESPTLHNISFGLSQTFEGKLRPPPGDTVTDPAAGRKIKLLSIQTSSVSYDFEQAKEEGKSGWQTQVLSNQFTSDLLPGFTLATTHDLWVGAASSDTARFDPFLTSISARFSLSGSTFRSLLAIVSGGTPEPQPAPPPPTTVDPQQQLTPPGTGLGPREGMDPTLEQFNQPRVGAPSGFQAGVTYDDQRRRPAAGASEEELRSQAFRANRTLGFNVSFSPTENWSVGWNTQYNLTTAEFGQHVLRLNRDMHRWRATFAFIKAPNGNFAFNFYINLTDQPEIKFQYDQRTVNR